eukprot:IDg19305t1
MMQVDNPSTLDFSTLYISLISYSIRAVSCFQYEILSGMLLLFLSAGRFPSLKSKLTVLKNGNSSTLTGVYSAPTSSSSF